MTENTKDWLSKEIASAKEELKSWPEWMVDVTHVSSSRYAGTLGSGEGGPPFGPAADEIERMRTTCALYCPACGENTDAELLHGQIVALPFDAALRCCQCETEFRVSLHPISGRSDE